MKNVSLYSWSVDSTSKCEKKKEDKSCDILCDSFEKIHNYGKVIIPFCWADNSDYLVKGILPQKRPTECNWENEKKKKK